MRQPFQIEGPSIQLSLTSLPSVAVQLSTNYTQAASFYNQSTADAYVAIGVSTATAVLPTTSATFNGYPIPFRQRVILSVPPNCWISALTTGATITAQLVVTPGDGIA